MKLDTIVKLDDDRKYYILDETIQNDKKYFLATKLDEKDEMTDISVIFEEKKINEEIFLKEVTNQDILKYIMSVFTTTLIKEIDEEKRED